MDDKAAFMQNLAKLGHLLHHFPSQLPVLMTADSHYANLLESLDVIELEEDNGINLSAPALTDLLCNKPTHNIFDCSSRSSPSSAVGHAGDDSMKLSGNNPQTLQLCPRQAHCRSDRNGHASAPSQLPMTVAFFQPHSPWEDGPGPLNILPPILSHVASKS